MLSVLSLSLGRNQMQNHFQSSFPILFIFRFVKCTLCNQKIEEREKSRNKRLKRRHRQRIYYARYTIENVKAIGFTSQSILSGSFLISIILMLLHMFGSLSKSVLQDDECALALSNEYSMLDCTRERGNWNGKRRRGDGKRTVRNEWVRGWVFWLNKGKYWL